MNLEIYKCLIDNRSSSVECDIVVRTYNEVGNITRFIREIKNQKKCNYNIIFLDSGSDDGTLELLKYEENISLYTVPKEKFNFGDSLDFLVSRAMSNIVISFSAHVDILDDLLVRKAIDYLEDFGAVAGYFRQKPNGYTGCSLLEKMFLKKIFFQTKFPTFILGNSQIPSNAASIYKKDIVSKYLFGESEGSEDKKWARRVSKANYKLLYMGNLIVFHSHNENEKQYYNRMIINYREQLKLGVNRCKYIQFIKIFNAMLLCGVFETAKEAYKFAKANYLATKEVYK